MRRQRAAVDPRRRQEARPREDRPRRVIEAELGARLGQADVGVEERAQRPDVGPVAVERVGAHLPAAERLRDDLVAEVDDVGLGQRFDERLPGEDVNPHRGHERLVGRGGEVGGRAGRQAAAHLLEPRRRRLLLEAFDLALAIEAEDAHAAGVLGVGRLGRDRDVGARGDVRPHHLVELHPIEVVAGEDQVVVGVQADEVRHRAPHGVGRALEPVGVLGRLLGGDDVDERLREVVEAVGLVDVPIERRGVELRQHEDAPDAGVQAVADRDVDEPVLAADRHGRLRAAVGEGVEALTLPAAQDDRQYVRHACLPSGAPPSSRGRCPTAILHIRPPASTCALRRSARKSCSCCGLGALQRVYTAARLPLR